MIPDPPQFMRASHAPACRCNRAIAPFDATSRESSPISLRIGLPFLGLCRLVFNSDCALFWRKNGAYLMDLSIKGVPEEQVARLRERAKANHRSLQGELRVLIEEATSGVPRKLSIDEVAARIGKLGLKRRNEAVRLIRADRDR